MYKKLFVFALVVLLLLFLAKAFWTNLQSATDLKDTTLKAFVIQKGESTNSIAQRLQEMGLVKSANVFKVALKLSGQAGSIQAGDFKLAANMNMQEIIKVLQNGAVDRWVTLLEGWRLEEMAQKLNQILGINAQELIEKGRKNEGYLFPDTYLINKDAKAGDIILRLKNTFEQRYSDELQQKIKALGLTPAQGIILASIVEREARTDAARTQVASVLLKRLRINMGLNADATIQYALGYQSAEKSWWKRGLTKEDLKVDSPFNTYLHVGLPPSPICNPGLSSIKAVANADPRTPYLYYYHDSKGNSYYAMTLEEHNKNISEHQ